jgi:hypothetical protein
VQASAFMAWLAVVLGWFALTVLVRGQRQRFAFGALVSAMVVIAGLDVLTPDALIVSTNARFGHLEAEAPFDARPLASFSADAAPAIVQALPMLPEDARGAVAERLRRQFGQDVPAGDWRSFNLSRARAREAVEKIS